MNLQETPSLILTPIIRGTNRELKFNCFQSIENGSPFTGLSSLTTSITFELKKTFNSTVIFTKEYAPGGTTTEAKINSASQLSIFIEPDDTSNLGSYGFVFVLTVEISTGGIYKVLGSLPII